MIDDYNSGRPFKAAYSSGKRHKYKLNPDSELLAEEFKNTLSLSNTVIPCTGTAARSFFYYLHQNGLQFKSNENKSSMDTALYFFRKLLPFLSGITFILSVLPLPPIRQLPAGERCFRPLKTIRLKPCLVYRAVPYPLGKRDYAILLLSSFTGIQAIDIANLTFENIRRGKAALHLYSIRQTK